MAKNVNTKDPFLSVLLRWAAYLSAFIPLIIFRNYLSPFHFGKVIIFRSAVEIAAVLYIILILKDKSYLPRWTKLFWAVSAFTAAFGLTTFTSVNFFPSFWGTLERMGGWFSMLHFWAFFVIISSVLRKKEHWLTLIKFVLIGGLLSACYGFLQKTSWDWIIGSGGRTKIFGTIGNPALFAGYMIFITFIAAIFSLLPSVTKNWRRFCVLLTAVAALAVLLTGVRGSVIALIVGIFLFGFLFAFEFGNPRFKKGTICFLIFVLVSAGLLFSLKNTSFVKNNQYLARYSDFSLTSTTIQTRFWAWKAGFDGFNDSLRSITVGYGPENFNIPFSKHFNPQFYKGPGSETLFDRAHNQFLEVLFTMGLIGFAAYISMFFFAFKSIKSFGTREGEEKKEYRIFKIGLSVTLIAYIIHNSFIFDTSVNYLVFFMILGLINFLSYDETRQSLRPRGNNGNKFQEPQTRNRFYLVGLVLMIPAILLVNYANIVPAKAIYTTTRGIVAGWSQQYDVAFDKFKEAMDYESFGKYEIRNRYTQYILDLAPSRGIDEKLVEQISTAVDYEKKNVNEFPHDYLPYLYLARSYILLGKISPDSRYNDMAIENCTKALEISPTFVRTYFELAQAYLNKGDFNDAIATFKKAIELNPDVGQSWWYLGLTQIEIGDKAAGAESLAKASRSLYPYDYNNETDLIRLIGYASKEKNYDLIIDSYLRLIEIAPENAQYHASLAVYSAQTGDIDRAVREAKTAADLDPSFEPEAKEFVRQLGRKW